MIKGPSRRPMIASGVLALSFARKATLGSAAVAPGPTRPTNGRTEPSAPGCIRGSRGECSVIHVVEASRGPYAPCGVTVARMAAKKT